MNLRKNAVEAAEDDAPIQVTLTLKDNLACCTVYNKEYITLELQESIFKKSSSTKGKNRGLGTYSIKLLAEKYLGGNIDFKSDKMNGTVFSLTVPTALNRYS